MKIFQQEILDGLADRITKSNSIAFEIIPSLAPNKEVEKTKAEIIKSVASESSDMDLLYFNSILCSVGWNKNDDVFDAKELWKARSTPVNKKINYMHNEKDIIGHMTNSNVIDFSGRYVPDDSNEDNVPDGFDVVVGGYIYSFWQDAELSARMAEILDKVNNQTLAVSMECIFPNFDYAIQTPDGQQKIIERNDATAFLTKHLRMYGGEGSYSGYKVGRLIRSMIFTGNALVDRPANPRSLILKSEAAKFAGSLANITIFEKVKNNMSEITKEQYDALVKKLEIAEAAVKEVNNKEITSLKELNQKLVADNDKLSAEAQKISGELTAAKELAKSHEDTSAKLNEQIQSLEAALAKAKEELDKHSKEMCKSKRKASMAELDIDEARANELIEKFVAVSDEIFDEFVKSMPKKKAQESTATVTTASVKEVLEKAENVDISVTVPSDTQNMLISKASEWFAETLSKKNKGE